MSKKGTIPVEQQIVDQLFGEILSSKYLSYAHHTQGVPEARLRFQERFEKALGQSLIRQTA